MGLSLNVKKPGCMVISKKSSNPKCNVFSKESFDVLLDGNADFDQSLFEFTSTTIDNKIMESPCEVKWLGSPEKSPTMLQGTTSIFGIQCDPHTPEDQTYDISHTEVVSPDKVIPTQKMEKSDKHRNKTLSQGQKSSHESSLPAEKIAGTLPNKIRSPCHKRVFNLSQVVPCASCSAKDFAFDDGKSEECMPSTRDDTQMVPLRLSKRKQSSPKRTPLYNISNLAQDIPVEFDESFKEAAHWIKKEISASEIQVQAETEIMLSASELHGLLKKEIIEWDENAAVTENVLEEECSKVLKETSGSLQSKLDLRKSSWMNGFMMYSRIHRKKFIQKHPGFHTAMISKLMGHAWRSMSSEEQRPYTYDLNQLRL
ncbi:transcription factor sox-14 [Plakobranchus ocellatus]|uniref:Sex-determining region Y protein n=1 Tax=Plakobranchus ocellatus TaxID=259542 RepID=A0AAV4DBP7_9GAST|nr:transcription factor sox-14 [Plakobranchus ocellatus]